MEADVIRPIPRAKGFGRNTRMKEVVGGSCFGFGSRTRWPLRNRDLDGQSVPGPTGRSTLVGVGRASKEHDRPSRFLPFNTPAGTQRMITHSASMASGLMVAACLAACASTSSSIQIISQASGSTYFSLGLPRVYKVQNGLELAGRVCRRGRTTLLSPPSVRIEHLAIGGETLEVAHASVGAIYRRADQACSGYSSRVTWQIADGESVRACFGVGRPCPSDAPVKAVISVPVPSTSPQ